QANQSSKSTLRLPLPSHSALPVRLSRPSSRNLHTNLAHFACVKAWGGRTLVSLRPTRDRKAADACPWGVASRTWGIVGGRRGATRIPTMRRGFKQSQRAPPMRPHRCHNGHCLACKCFHSEECPSLFPAPRLPPSRGVFPAQQPVAKAVSI